LKKSIYSEKQRRLCAFLKKARLKAGLSQQLVAKKLGKPQSFIAKYEGGERRLDIIELVAVADVIDVSMKDIIAAIE